MKALLRSEPVTFLLGLLIWAWMAMIGRTVRWKVEGVEGARAHWMTHNGFVVAAWHSRIILLPTGWVQHMRHWPGLKGKGAMLISLSKDGEPVARALQYFGLQAIRGSAANKKKARKDKGGVRAIAEAVRLIRSGGGLCVTPDGPRGPAEIVSLGTVMIAQRAGVPVIPYAISVKPALRLNSWDRFIIPFPFTRGAIVYGDPLETSRENDTDALRAELQKRLDAATQRADMLAGYSAATTLVTDT